MKGKLKKLLALLLAVSMNGIPVVTTGVTASSEPAVRNIAKNRAAYHSSAANYNDTGHLVTDGIKMPGASDRNPVITAQWSDSPAAESCEKAFDNNKATKFFCYHPSVWIQYQFPGQEAYVVSKYSITTANDRPDRDPSAWNLLGSNDGENFTVLDSRSEYTFSTVRGATETFDTNNKTAYRIYRLDILQNSGNTQTNPSIPGVVGQTQLADLNLIDSTGNTLLIRDDANPVFISRWVSKTAANESVYIDLGGESQFGEIRLLWDTVNYAKSYEIQTSDDAKTWTTVFTDNNGLGGDKTIHFTPVKAQYVKLVANQSNSTNFTLYEFEVYGTNDVTVIPKPLPAPEADGRQFLRGGNWKLQRASEVYATGEQLSASYDDSDWVVATVPGTILVSYLNNGAIPDPTYGDQQLQVSDSFFGADFWYRDSFVVAPEKEGQEIWLNFNNINWKADVYFNGTNIGRIEGAFIRGKFNVTDLVNFGGQNYLAVLIHRNETYGTPKLQNASSPGTNGSNIPMSYDSPTILPSYGWDWTPTIRGRDIGIYGDVFLSYSGTVLLSDPWIETHLKAVGGTSTAADAAIDQSKAYLTFRTEVTNTSGAAVEAVVKGTIQPLGKTYQQTVQVPVNGTVNVEIPLEFENPELWWPNRYGDQYLYTNETAVEVNGKISNVQTFQFGIREMRYSTNNPLKIYVNGARIYCSGGNWGMDEGLLRCNTAEEYDIRVRLHKELGFTMIRNWVGQTGNEYFWDACDKYGILIMDEFWQSSTDKPDRYPPPNDQVMFMANAVDKLKVVRKHPSVAFYCGANESTPTPAALNIALRDAVSAYDASRIYVPDSARGQLSGFGPYGVQGPNYYFSNSSASFHTERGMPNIPAVESIKKFIPEDYLWPMPSDMWGMHDFTTGGAQNGALFIEQAKLYGDYSTLEGFVKRAQMVNYENHKALFEAPEVFKGNAMLMWMSQSAWPSFVWQTYDYYFDTNAGYFGIKKANQKVNALYDTRNNAIVLANNSGQNYTDLILEVDSFNLDGDMINAQSVRLDLSADEVKLNPVGKPVTGSSTDINFIETRVKDSAGNVISDNFYWMTLASTRNFEQLQNMPDVKLSTSCEALEKKGTTNFYKATLKNYMKTPALMIRVMALDNHGKQILPTYYSDNYFSLMPGESKEVIIEFEDKYVLGDNPEFFIEGWNIERTAFGEWSDREFIVSGTRFVREGALISMVSPGTITLEADISALTDIDTTLNPIVALYKNGQLIDVTSSPVALSLKQGEQKTIKSNVFLIPEMGNLLEYTVKGYLWDADYLPVQGASILGGWRPGNIALKVPVRASSAEGSNPPANAVDGNASGTRWASNGPAWPSWIEIDLGAESVLDDIKLSWFDPSGRSYRWKVYGRSSEITDWDSARPANHNFDTDSAYTLLVDRSQNTVRGEQIIDSLNKATARYIAIQVTGGTNTGGNPSIYEIEIIGYKQ